MEYQPKKNRYTCYILKLKIFQEVDGQSTKEKPPMQTLIITTKP